MTKNYVLIDFENVQPKNVELLSGHPFNIYVFVGANQTKVPFDLAAAMQQFGSDARYIKIVGNGHNALDFHIACYIGELTTKEPDACFYVISKDKGFDPLIRHLKSRQIKVLRVNDLAEIPVLRVKSSSTMDEKIATIVKNLKGRGQSKPRKVRTLLNTVNSLFTTKLDEAELQAILAGLEQRKYIHVREGGRVSYRLPES